MVHLFGEDKIKAIAYYRHSAEDKQENSVEIQREQVRQFADKEDIQIIDEIADEGYSGLTTNRPGFQKLLNDWVLNDKAPKINYILVLDASRFGRFQKMSEVWRLLGLCEERGIKLASVTRGLPRAETSVMDSFIITLDFGMSGEYSKTLSDKVFKGCVKVSEQGFSAGGCAPYGYTRVLLDEQKKRLYPLKPGQHKVIANQRVTIEPADNGETEIVKRIFHEFVDLQRFPNDIARQLTEDGLLAPGGFSWRPSTIIRILTSETYIGTRVYNKTWHRLQEPRRRNPKDEWVRAENVHPAIVDASTFYKAQERMYWLRPRLRNRNLRYLHKAEKYIGRFVTETIADGNYTDEEQFRIIRNLPIVFGATYVVDGMKRRCFYIPEELRQHEELLACGVDTTGKNDTSLDVIYNVPTENLHRASYLVITGADEDCAVLDPNELPEKIHQLSGRILDMDISVGSDKRQ